MIIAVHVPLWRLCVSYIVKQLLKSQPHMSKRKLLLLGGMAFCAAIVLAQTLPPTLPSKSEGGIITMPQPEMAKCISQLNGRRYMCLLTFEEAKSGRAWKPSSPLPLSLDQAEEIARKELRKLVKDDFAWEFTELCIRRLRGTAGSIWYLAATLKPILAIGEVNSDSFTVLINTSGQPGRIARSSSAGE